MRTTKNANILGLRFKSGFTSSPSRHHTLKNRLCHPVDKRTRGESESSRCLRPTDAAAQPRARCLKRVSPSDKIGHNQSRTRGGEHAGIAGAFHIKPFTPAGVCQRHMRLVRTGRPQGRGWGAVSMPWTAYSPQSVRGERHI